jgi:hypothetical protein
MRHSKENRSRANASKTAHGDFFHGTMLAPPLSSRGFTTEKF